jgi:hypothetical protein
MAATACRERARGIVTWVLDEGFAKASAAETWATVEGPPTLQCDVRRELQRGRALEQRVVYVHNDTTWEVGVGVGDALGGLLPGHDVAVLTGNAGGLADPLWTSIVVLSPKPDPLTLANAP